VVSLHSLLAFRAESHLGSANRYYGRRLHLEVSETTYGLLAGTRRDASDDEYNWRLTPVLFPSSSMFTVGRREEKGVLWIRMWIPIDDEHTAQWRVRWHPTEPLPSDIDPESGPGGYLPEGSHWYEQWRPRGNRTNDYLLDRKLQGVNFCGVPSFPLQDKMATESMGPIADRTQEHLGPTDVVIIAMRRRLLAAAKALQDSGVPPPGVDTPEVYAVRSAIVNLPRTANWVEASRNLTKAVKGQPAVNSV
jgi:phthalate 4,5-dioxygenase